MQTARVLLARGWRVRALHRKPDEAAGATGFGKAVEWIKGDAMSRDDVMGAAAGAAVIVHAVNPPKYHALPLEYSRRAGQHQAPRVHRCGAAYSAGSGRRPVSRMGVREHRAADGVNSEVEMKYCRQHQ